MSFGMVVSVIRFIHDHRVMKIKKRSRLLGFLKELPLGIFETE